MIELYRLFAGSLATRGRIAAVGIVALVPLLIGAAAGAQSRVDRTTLAIQVVGGLGLSLLVPVTALVFASAALGEPAEDATLVYLWLAPVARWRLAVAALLATLTVTIPLTVVPVTLTALLTRAPVRLAWAAAGSSAVALIAYVAVFVGLGLVVKRALAWGLAYVLIWEGVIAKIGRGPARASVYHYAASLLTALSGRPRGPLDVATVTAVVVPLAIAAAALAATSLRLAHQDVA